MLTYEELTGPTTEELKAKIAKVRCKLYGTTYDWHRGCCNRACRMVEAGRWRGTRCRSRLWNRSAGHAGECDGAGEDKFASRRGWACKGTGFSPEYSVGGS
jgi:hypothetical protein